MRIALLILVFLIFQSIAFSQSSYVPFPEDGAVWHVGYFEPSYGVGRRHDQYAYAGDTLINAFTYHKLSHKIDWIGPGEFSEDEGIIGFIRQDSLQKKVYYYPRNDIQEFLLFDFDLQIGDLYPQTYTHGLDGATVFSIDSMVIDNNFRRVFVFSPMEFDTLKLIEGIGANSGLLSPAVIGNCFESCWWLSCFQVNGVSLYSFNNIYASHDMCIPIGIAKETENSKEISLSSNIVSRGDVVRVTNNFNHRMTVSVFDLQGRRVLEINKSEFNCDIETFRFSKGIYILKIMTDQSLATSKLFIQ